MKKHLRLSILVLAAFLAITMTTPTSKRSSDHLAEVGSLVEPRTPLAPPTPRWTIDKPRSVETQPVEATTTTPAPATTSSTNLAPVVVHAQAVEPPPATTTPVKHVASSAATTAAPAPPSSVAASVATQSVNDFLFNALNKERTARGLTPLRLDQTLAKMAQDWSVQMGNDGAMSHSGSGIPNGFNAYGENVLKASSGTNASGMHDLWFESSGHRKQMLQPGFDRVGIGSVCVNGSVYATETFGRSESSGDANLSADIPDGTAKAPPSGGPTCS